MRYFTDDIQSVILTLGLGHHVELLDIQSITACYHMTKGSYPGHMMPTEPSQWQMAPVLFHGGLEGTMQNHHLQESSNVVFWMNDYRLWSKFSTNFIFIIFFYLCIIFRFFIPCYKISNMKLCLANKRLESHDTLLQDWHHVTEQMEPKLTKN